MLSPSLIQVLVVDDDPAIARLVETIIAHRFADEIRVKAVTDPRAAREWLTIETVDLLITDLEMPGISGLQLTRSAKRRNAFTQVFVLTGHSTLDAVVDAMDLGASDYLLKPLSEAQLVEAVQQAICRLNRWREAACQGALNIG